MSSKNDILSAIRKHTGEKYGKPEITLDAITYDDQIEQFAASLKAAGGTAVILQSEEELDRLIRQYYPSATRIATNLPGIGCATFNPDDVAAPGELNGTDVAIVQGSFGVAENGAVWIPQQVKYKALYFISTNLVILMKKEDLVNNMHEAYRRIEGGDYSFGAFISGPSKTADIEQALVFGAHGPVGVLVILM